MKIPGFRKISWAGFLFFGMIFFPFPGNLNAQSTAPQMLADLCWPDEAETFPWLSEDGLRLYFLGDFNGETRLFMSWRNSVWQDFGSRDTVAFDKNIGIGSFWLNRAETRIWFVRQSNTGEFFLVRAERKSASQAFQNYQIQQLEGMKGHFSGPSLSEDESELMLYLSDGKDWIISLKKAGENQYRLKETLQFPAGWIPGHGKLSHDGLKYFIGLHSYDSGDGIYCLERKKVHHSFDSQNIRAIAVPNLTGWQPCINGTGNLLVFVFSQTGKISGSDLHQVILEMKN